MKRGKQLLQAPLVKSVNSSTFFGSEVILSHRHAKINLNERKCCLSQLLYLGGFRELLSGEMTTYVSTINTKSVSNPDDDGAARIVQVPS